MVLFNNYVYLLPQGGADALVFERTAVGWARDLVNLGPADCTPTHLADAARSLARESGLACEVRDGRWGWTIRPVLTVGALIVAATIPLSLLFACVAGLRRRLFALGLLKAERLPVPVIGRIEDGQLRLDMRCLDGAAAEAAFVAQLPALAAARF